MNVNNLSLQGEVTKSKTITALYQATGRGSISIEDIDKLKSNIENVDSYLIMLDS